MTSDISSSEVGSLNDADSIVGQTFCIVTTPPRRPADNVNNKLSVVKLEGAMPRYPQ
jgi:hypothetical protein